MQSNPEVKKKFQEYPIAVREKMNQLRKLILESAASIETIHDVEETLKWNEPSYLTKKGSTIRIDWKEKTPDQYAIYFKCTSKLIPTFRETYGDLFTYDGNRAIIFTIHEKIPEPELKECISAGLTYHHIKHLPYLGLRKIN